MPYSPPPPPRPYELGGSVGGGDGNERARRPPFERNLDYQSWAAGRFGDIGEGGYLQMTAEARAERERLRRIAEGRESVSAEQLREGLRQNLAAQRSMAAGGAPDNAALAAFAAAKQMGRIESGSAGQMALARMQEQQAAQRALADLIQRQRQQELEVATGARGTAIDAAGSGYATGSSIPREPSDWEKYGPAGMKFGAGLLTAVAFSDRRLKTDISDGDRKARAAMDGLRAFAYKYKDGRHGKGEQLGIMAQDLEAAGLDHAVIDTPEGKMVHGAKLATSLAAMLPGLSRRISKLEGRSK